MACAVWSPGSVPTVEAAVVVQLPAELGEGTLWDARSQQLLWVDIMRARLYRFDPNSGVNEEHDLSAYSKFVSSVVPLREADDPTGDFVALTLGEGFAVYNFRERSLRILPGNPSLGENERFNDGKVSPTGSYWAGTIARDATGQPIGKGGLYRRNLDGSVDKVVEEVAISNGLSWHSDCRTFYHTDTPNGTVDAWDYDVVTGAITNRRPCIEHFDFQTTGFPDGHAQDIEGMLWVARFNGGRVGRYDPKTGALLAEVTFPETAGKQITSVAFGGADLGDMYISTAHEGVTAETAAEQGLPEAGCLFRVTREALTVVGGAAGKPAHSMCLPQSGFLDLPVASV